MKWSDLLMGLGVVAFGVGVFQFNVWLGVMCAGVVVTFVGFVLGKVEDGPSNKPTGT